jgi:hypothetical protein
MPQLLSGGHGTKLWGGLFNSADNHNDNNIALEKSETKDDIKTPPTHDSPVVFHETIPTEAYELNSLNGEILDQGSLEDASGANVCALNSSVV